MICCIFVKIYFSKFDRIHLIYLNFARVKKIIQKKEKKEANGPKSLTLAHFSPPMQPTPHPLPLSLTYMQGPPVGALFFLPSQAN